MPVEPRAIGAIYEVRSSDGRVTLDVENDSYSCCYDPQLSEPSAADRLLSDRDPTEPWVALPAPLTKSLGLRDVAYFLWALLCATLDFRSKTFADLLRDQAARRAQNPLSDAEAIARATTRFVRLGLWCPIQFQCFFRAIFLLRFLRLHGLTADWIFGAALFPFDAHCWLAVGPFLLTDRPDRILRFKILLMIDGAPA